MLPSMLRLLRIAFIVAGLCLASAGSGFPWGGACDDPTTGGPSVSGWNCDGVVYVKGERRIYVNAYDDDLIEEVKLYVDDDLVPDQNHCVREWSPSPPTSSFNDHWDWNTGGYSQGKWYIYERVRDSCDNWETLGGYSRTVDRSSPDACAITDPGASECVSDGVSITANVHDNFHMEKVVFRYQYYEPGQGWQASELIGVDEDGSDGWGITWPTAGLSDGQYRIFARAFDCLNAYKQSSMVLVYVCNHPSWAEGTAISASITAPQEDKGYAVGSNVQCSASGSDSDDYGCTGTPCWDCSSDTVTFTWSATRGSFPYGNTGSSVTWKAPSTPELATIAVTVDDTGTTMYDDAEAQDSVEVDVWNVDEVHVAYELPDNWSDYYPYPFDNTSVAIKAVVISTHTIGGQATTRAYCDESGTGSEWYIMGKNGPCHPDPTDDFTNFPTIASLSESGDYDTIYAWQSADWGELEFIWSGNYGELIHYRDTDDCNTIVTHDAKYSYNKSSASWSTWGTDGITFGNNNRGLHRYRVRVQAADEYVESANHETATRVCVRASDSFGLTEANDYYPYRKKLVQWAFAFKEEPYEWGGHYWGGRNSPDSCEGGGSTYEGYGIDCSGLVSACARYAGYNWNFDGITIPWRLDCVLLGSDAFGATRKIDLYVDEEHPGEEDQPGAGDVYVDDAGPYRHVVILRGGKEPDGNGGYRYPIIQAEGSAGTTGKVKTGWYTKGKPEYEERRLLPSD